VARLRFEIRGTWDGQPLLPGELARLELRIDPARHALAIAVEATHHGDPPPEAPPGPTPRLWEYEVVELFLLGRRERYLEVELGPHGHHLALRLEGRRRIVESGLPVDYRVEHARRRWRGEARLSLDWLPEGVFAANAYAIHGRGRARRHLAAHPVPGPEPDFHRLECFAPIDLVQA
jgi:hypothetical protein